MNANFATLIRSGDMAQRCELLRRQLYNVAMMVMSDGGVELVAADNVNGIQFVQTVDVDATADKRDISLTE